MIAMGTVLVAANRDHGVAATQAPSTTPAIPSFPSTATYLRGAPVGPCVIVRAGFNCTAPGTYRLDPDVATVAAAIDVPRGWFEWDLGSGTAGVLVDSGSNAPNGSGWGILFSSFGRVRADPCDPAAGFVEPPVGHPAVDTAAEVVQAMQQWPGFQVSTPRPITIGGYNGLLVEVTSSRTVISCPTAEVWEAASGIAVDGLSDRRPADAPSRPVPHPRDRRPAPDHPDDGFSAGVPLRGFAGGRREPDPSCGGPAGPPGDPRFASVRTQPLIAGPRVDAAPALSRARPWPRPRHGSARRSGPRPRSWTGRPPDRRRRPRQGTARPGPRTGRGRPSASGSIARRRS